MGQFGSSSQTAPRTFLSPDLENSSALWDRARHDQLMREAVGKHNGRIVKTTGDGLHAVFNSPLDGLAAALAGQQSMAAETGPLKVRKGLHTGESQAREGDYYGSTVNEAARIAGCDHGASSPAQP